MANFILIIGSVLLQFFSLPNKFLHLGLLGWVALIPFFVIFIREKHRPKALFYAWLFFLFLFVVVFWINPFCQPERFANVYVLSGTILFFLVIPFFGAITFFFARNIAEKAPLILKPFVFAAVWVFFEYYICVFHIGPALPAAVSQSPFPILIQSANIFGVYGLGFLIMLVNAALAFGCLEFGQNKKKVLVLFVVVLLLFVFNLGYGGYVLHNNKKYLDPVVIGIVQPNSSLLVNSFMGRNGFFFRSQMLKLFGISKELILKQRVDYLLWPELAVGRYLAQDEEIFLEIKKFVQAGRIPLILGSSFFEWDKKKACNVIFSLNREGEITDIYRKNYLIPLFETSDYTKGNILKPLSVAGRLRSIGGMICFESNFPQVSWRLIQQGASLLVLLSNDVWFGKTNWPYLHAADIVFRAVETGRFAIHLNNSGPSVAVDNLGRSLLITPAFQTAYGIVSIYPLKNQTIYVKYGDWFPMLCLFIILVPLFKSVYMKIKKNYT